MLAYITGKVAAIRGDSIILDRDGIGIRIFVPGSVAESLQTGNEERIYTHLVVREDALQLCGFLTEDDLEIFRLLLGVSGVGPRGAMGILTALSADDLRFAVLSEDAAAISKAPGIGKKTAQKVILELKDKLKLEDAFEKKSARAEGSTDAGSANQEAVLALTALGIGNAEAVKAVRAASSEHPGAGTEDLIREALRKLY